MSNVNAAFCITGHTLARSCSRSLQFDDAEQRQADLKLLEAPDIGTGVGGKPKVLVPKAVDADEEGDDDDDEDSDSSDDEVRVCVASTQLRAFYGSVIKTAEV